MRSPCMLMLLAACAADEPSDRLTTAVSSSVVTIWEQDPEGIDPAFNYSSIGWQIEYATGAKLLNYADAAGTPQLIPEVATAMPTVSADGTVYTFTVGHGYTF